jgi:predicted Ser/Thr protein kinase
MDIKLGALSPKLSEQIESLPEIFDKDADAITRLYIRGLLTDLETKKARKRLVKMANTWIISERKTHKYE